MTVQRGCLDNDDKTLDEGIFNKLLMKIYEISHFWLFPFVIIFSYIQSCSFRLQHAAWEQRYFFKVYQLNNVESEIPKPYPGHKMNKCHSLEVFSVQSTEVGLINLNSKCEHRKETWEFNWRFWTVQNNAKKLSMISASATLTCATPASSICPLRY